MTKLRVLALHGFGQSALIFRTQIAAICRACVEDVEFVFLDGPIALHAPDQPSSSLIGDDGYTLPLHQPSIDDSTPRGWCTFNEDKTRYEGLDDAFRVLIPVLRRERFDGVFGFSQGAALASYLCAYLENPSAHFLFYPAFHPPFRFAIFASGFAPVDPPLPHRIQTPTLHVLGRHDTHIGRAESWPLVKACSSARVETHPGGHFVGTKRTWTTFFREWMAAFAPGSLTRSEDVFSPVPRISSSVTTPVESDSSEPDSPVDSPLSTPTISSLMDLEPKWMLWAAQSKLSEVLH